MPFGLRFGLWLMPISCSPQAGEQLDGEAQIEMEMDPTGIAKGLITQTMPFFSVIHRSIPTRNLMVVQQPMDRLAGPYLLTNSQGEVGIVSQVFFSASIPLELAYNGMEVRLG